QPPRCHEGQRLDAALDVVLALQPRDDDVELQRAGDADDRLAPALHGIEHLHQPFFLELLDAVVELLPAGVLEPQPAEMFGREALDWWKGDRRAGVEGVTNRHPPGVDDADDVAGAGFGGGLTVAAEHAV